MKLNKNVCLDFKIPNARYLISKFIAKLFLNLELLTMSYYSKTPWSHPILAAIHFAYSGGMKQKSILQPKLFHLDFNSRENGLREM